ncbi:STAS domain-containing protein [Microbispora sp. KK1-11]|uniref:STAS domain-containing protein n=1 Tax=Microbispora sp. KK1-11 TaxID=2053005 RepID=UPI00115AE560|nr:STAS domain-containing protein [Microbispora sp. KK1-11]TQS25509.1 STAS domain-containing protein [Microbispora sp. KK1-11]
MDLWVNVTQRESDSAVVCVSGEMDLFSCAKLEGAVAPLLADGCVHLVLDAVRLKFCDLAGVRTLERVHTAAASASGGLIVWASRPLGRLLALLWPEGRPGRPTVVRAAPVAPLERRLVLLPGRFEGSGRRPVAPVRSGETARPIADSGGREALLEHSRLLREQARTHMATMRERAWSLCTGLADAQERLAVLHNALAERPCSGLSCDGDSHRVRADGFRRQAETFARR